MFTGSSNRIIRDTIILAVLLLSCFTSTAQSWNLAFNLGVGSYSHNELHHYQEYLQQEMVVDATIVDEFSPYLIYSAEINKQFEKIMLGIEVTHGSTGGRLYYEDYSGKIVADQKLKYNQITMNIYRSFLDKNNFQLMGGLKVGLVFNTLGIDNSIKLMSQEYRETIDFGAINLGFQPNVTWRKCFNRIFFKGVLGYEVQTSARLETKDDDKLYLEGENNRPVHLQGNGFRIGLGLGIMF